MISPGGIPQFTGDFDELDKDVSALRSDAIGIRNGGADVHSRFQMLGAFYTAPEADTLFATTRPVMDKADTFAAKLETVADALDTFAIEARPLAERLKQLKADAVAFTDSVEGDDDWTEDEKKVDRNKQLIDDVTATQSAFQDAERRAASKITAVVGGPAFVTDDGSGLVKRNTVPYGYDPALFEGAKELPWGSVDDKTYESWSLGWFGHGAKSLVWDGIYKDGIEAAAKGLWALGTGDGEAWSGLKDVATGIGLYTITPYDAFMDWAVGPDKESADEVRAKKAAKEFAKGIVAWDQWEENPARATGTVLFNVLTLGAGPLAAASKAGKGGLASNAAGAAAKAGLYMDPLYVGLRATGAAAGKLPKLSDLTSRITTGAGTAADAQRVHSVIELEDGSRVVIENGEFIAYDRQGNVVPEAARQERSSDVDHTSPEQSVSRERDLVGVAGRNSSQHVGGAGPDTPTDVGYGTSRSTGGAETSRFDGSSDSGRAVGDGVTVEGSAASSGRGQDGSQSGGDGELPADEVKRRQDELVKKANDPEWRKKYYDGRGHRISKNTVINGVELPIIKQLENGMWVAKYDVPSGPSEVKLGSHPLGPETVPEGNLAELDKAAANRTLSLELTNAEKAFKKSETPEASDALARARNAYADQLGGRPNNSKIAEELGEKAVRLHVAPRQFGEAVEVPLPKTPNGADAFDLVYDRGDGRYLIVEAKAPSGDLDWRNGVADPEDPSNPHVGDDGGAKGMRVKQGTRLYVRSILGLMARRGGRDAEIAADLRNALKAGKLEYAMVKAQQPNGTSYAGAVFEYLKI
ncbi:hypothetical protein AB0L56_14935 [Streptomyces sp. NPDC052079]|uniref:hypothetical protein n=1 Tax=Streptomyces sp. NPDC052079 TaxID=3155526 RepID=UPI0034249BC2